ncbi:MAG: hypothetical protein M1828_007326 [Chrysothrix sp. TS-e1954]|nr:MAG: hypothetical protein M1828_007326 [Chrysothrix sp. TS-e1954]
MASDLEQLVEMGFDKERAQIALGKGGSLQNAMDWLEKNQDKTLDEIKADSTTADGDEDGPALQPGEQAMSLICNDCGKKFRSQAQAEFHANKTEHVNFAESTEEIAPLTETEKKAKLDELYKRRDEKRAAQASTDTAERKRNDEIKRKSTKDQQKAKEDLEYKEKMKEAAAKKREKQDDIDAKKRIQAKIAADKEERRRKAEVEKANREGQTFPVEAVKQSLPAGTPAPSTGPTTSKPASEYKETRLRLQTPNGTIQQAFPVETTLKEVALAVAAQNGSEVNGFQQTYPKKLFDGVDLGQTLKQAGLVPSAALIIK